MNRLCLLVVCEAPLAARACDLASALVAAGWRVRPMATPAALSWVDADLLAAAAAAPVRAEFRSPSTPKDRERPAEVVVAPATFNTLNKLAAGIADTQAHASLSEALGEGLPFYVVPTINEKLWTHPALPATLTRLTAAGVTWLSPETGLPGPPHPTSSAESLAATFDPAWIPHHLPSARGDESRP